MLENIYSIAFFLLGYTILLYSCHSLCVSDAVRTEFLTFVTFSTCPFLAAIDSPPFHLYTLLMWCVYTQPPKKALDYVQDHSSGVSNEVKTNYSLFSVSTLESATVNRHICATHFPIVSELVLEIYFHSIVFYYPASLSRH